MVLAGFGNGGAVVANITLVQRGAEDRVRGRVFTLLMSVNYAVLGARVRRRRPGHERRSARAGRTASRPCVIVTGAAVGWLLLRGAESLQPYARTA